MLTNIPLDPSPHCSERVKGSKIQYIIIHAMSGTYEGSRAWFKNPKSKVSAHYLISKKGDIVQMVPLAKAAWHVRNFNSPTIGIELEDLNKVTKKNCMSDPKWYTEAELDTCARLVAKLLKVYNIPLSRVIGHDDQLLKKKKNDHTDPGPYFPWPRFKTLITKYQEESTDEQ